MKKAIFIDRDGTLIEEVNFLSKVEDLRIFSYTKDAISHLKIAGYAVIVVTNQSGIGRNLYTETDMNRIHDVIQAELDGAIDAFYFCPHLPDAGCLCRKPNTGMIDTACADHSLGLAGSWMIGDKKLDIETGFKAGIATGMVMTGYGSEHRLTLSREPDHIGENLLDVVQKIILS